ncbi:extracellular solute-binding protein [Bacillus sp. FJAT-28004]|uniref:extracellular solute-binding protein n=1 Tax=Bacillus sp. FJAT-28004 TaxID=1679165 RepID=UPI0006B61521|nr:extracellular solute-binding protein [Bacillus sp. FJAT-28004]
MKKVVGNKTWGLMLCTILVLTSVLSGCGNAENEEAGNSSKSPSTAASPSTTVDVSTDVAAEEIVNVSMMNIYHTDTAPADDDAVIKSVEEISKADLKMTYVPSNVYAEKINVTMASGEMPQIIMVDNPFTTSIINGIESGMFWDITPYLDEFPNLANYNEQMLNNLQIDGKMYVIPRPRPLVRNGLVIRKDWLEKVGLELPTTVDEFYHLVKAFKEKDPDSNGKDDTYGMMLYEGVIPADLYSWFGAPNNWKVEDGKFIKDIETAEYKEGLKFVRKLYSEGLVNANFPVVVRNEARKDLYNNKVGISLEPLDAVVTFYYFQMEETKNHFDLIAGHPIAGKAFATAGHYGGAMIPKTSVKTEDELKKVLRYFDTQNSAEATEKFTKLVTENEEKPGDEKFNIDDLKNLIVNNAAMYPPGKSELNVMLKSRMEEHSAVSISDPSIGLISPTQIEKGEQLKTVLQDASIQFILGKIDEASLDAAIEQWKKIGGSQVAKELAELYSQK